MLRMHCSRLGLDMVVIGAGEQWSSREAVVIGTCLGSCVATCLMDRDAGVAGMNHFMLAAPLRPEHFFTADAGRFGIWAMESLVNDLLRLGASRKRLCAKVFGGANVLGWSKEGSGAIGQSNVLFALECLEAEHIPVLARETGGSRGRGILFNARTGEVQVRKLTFGGFENLVQRERRFRPAPHPRAGELTVFSSLPIADPEGDQE